MLLIGRVGCLRGWDIPMLLIHVNPSHWSINWRTLYLTLKLTRKNTTWELHSVFTLQLSNKTCDDSSLPLTCKQAREFWWENALASPFACGSRMNSHNSPKWRASLHAALPFNCRSSWNWWNLVLIQFITQHRKATTFLSVYHENKGLCKKNACNVWKLVWLLTVCKSYPPMIIMSLFFFFFSYYGMELLFYIRAMVTAFAD